MKNPSSMMPWRMNAKKVAKKPYNSSEVKIMMDLTRLKCQAWALIMLKDLFHGIPVIKDFTYINFSFITFVLTCIILYSKFKLLLNESYSDLLKHTMAYSPTSIVVITWRLFGLRNISGFFTFLLLCQVMVIIPIVTQMLEWKFLKNRW